MLPLKDWHYIFHIQEEDACTPWHQLPHPSTESNPFRGEHMCRPSKRYKEKLVCLQNREEILIARQFILNLLQQVHIMTLTQQQMRLINRKVGHPHQWIPQVIFAPKNPDFVFHLREPVHCLYPVMNLQGAWTKQQDMC